MWFVSNGRGLWELNSSPELKSTFEGVYGSGLVVGFRSHRVSGLGWLRV